MFHESVLNKHFQIKQNQDWISFKAKQREQLVGFGTKRVAKLSNENHFVFTIGETKKGKSNRLTSSIEAIIVQYGLPVIEESTTNGTLRNEKLYKGFDLSACTPKELDKILNEVEHLVAQSR